MFDISSKQLKKHFENVYNIYNDYNVKKHFKEDIKVFINRAVDRAVQSSEIVNLTLLTDAMFCPLFEERITGLDKDKDISKIIRRGNNNGRKCN